MTTIIENIDSGTRFYGDDITDDELASWDDIDGIELGERLADESVMVSPPWLSALLYSDDDDDVVIPRHIIDNL